MCPVTQPCQHSSTHFRLPPSQRTYRRNLGRQIDVLGQAQLALLQRALEVRLLDGVACIALLVDQGDEPVLNLQVHLAALANLLLEVA
jgi:hypothetical protein